MLQNLSLAELQAQHIDLSAAEAVAVAQKLIHGDVGVEPRPPLGPPSPENLVLTREGALVCRGGDATPSVFELGILLQGLLPSGTARASGALRYAIARALLEVDAPPFDSLSDFGRTLSRYEQGDRDELLRGLAARVTPIDRRRAPLAVTEFRRALREADRQLYELRAAPVHVRVVPIDINVRGLAGAPPAPAESVAGVAPRLAPRSRRMARAPLAAGIAAGLALVAAGQFMSPRRAPLAGGAPTVASGIPAADDREGHMPSASPAPSDSTPQVASLLGGQSATPDQAAGLESSLSSRPLAQQPVGLTAAAGDPVPPAPPSLAAPPVSVPPARVPAAGTVPVQRGFTPQSSFAPPTGDAMIVRALDDQQRPVFSPAFASNGTALFFHTGRSADVASAIATAEEDGGELRVMTIVDDGSKNYHVQPSPDGQSIAFDSDRDGERGVYVARRDGSGVRRVSGPGYAAVPTWSPDGNRLAFIRAEPNNPRVWNLWLLPLPSGRAERLTNFRYGQTWSASWFPDGDRIAFTHEDRLIVEDLSTRRSREYKSPIDGRLVRTPAVSPDGTKVIFQVYRDGGWLLDLNDGSMRRVLDDPSAEEFAWSRDGRRVAFHSRRDGEWGIWLLGGV